MATLESALLATSTSWSKDGEERVVPDYRARVMAAGKILDVAMKVDDLAARVAGYQAQRREAPTGRLLTPDELAAMTPYDRMQAVLMRKRVVTVEVVAHASRVLEDAEAEAAPDDGQ